MPVRAPIDDFRRVLAGAARGSWSAFELRFFWEAPAEALYTAAVGGLLYRLFRG